MSDAPLTSSQLRDNTLVKDFIARVQERALLQHNKSKADDLTLMEMLNAFDHLVAQENCKNRANSMSPNGNEVHNQAYRQILK